jgi:hypothetical protein
MATAAAVASIGFGLYSAIESNKQRKQSAKGKTLLIHLLIFLSTLLESNFKVTLRYLAKQRR